MTDNNLKLLTFGITSKLDPEFRAGRAASVDVADYVQKFPREVDLRPFNTVVVETMKRFARKDAAKSDEWLGPRLHHALRLRRTEAAHRGIWLYLAIAERPDYVVWRWGSEDETKEPPGVDRFAGPDYKHAFGRLWWMAELFRNGPDYAPAVKALSSQDIPNNLFRMDIAHHRPTLQGAVATLFPGGRPLPQVGDKANALAKAANAAVTTLQLDLLAPDEMLDESAAKEWIERAGEVDALASCGDLPQGPDDPKAAEESVKTMTALLTTLLSEAPLRDRGTQEAPPASPADADEVATGETTSSGPSVPDTPERAVA